MYIPTACLLSMILLQVQVSHTFVPFAYNPDLNSSTGIYRLASRRGFDLRSGYCVLELH